MPAFIAFPIYKFVRTKLGALFIKHVSKPLVARIVTASKKSPVFKNYIIIPPAQFYNWCEKKIATNWGKRHIPKLREDYAVELGARLLGEGTLFTIAAVLLYREWTRSVRKDLEREAKVIQELDGLKKAVQDLYTLSEKYATQIQNLLKNFNNIERKINGIKWSLALGVIALFALFILKFAY